MQAFEDLKQDIQNLIDTASDTIRQIVDDAAQRVRDAQTTGAPVGTVGGVPVGTDSNAGAEFTSQVEELRNKVRQAVDNLKQQAKAALENPSFPSGGGSSGSTPPTDTSPAAGGGAAGGNPSGTPQSETAGLNQGAIDSNNVDDQMPAGGKDTGGLPPPPNFGGSAIGPDSFKSGA